MYRHAEVNRKKEESGEIKGSWRNKSKLESRKTHQMLPSIPAKEKAI